MRQTTWQTHGQYYCTSRTSILWWYNTSSPRHYSRLRCPRDHLDKSSACDTVAVRAPKEPVKRTSAYSGPLHMQAILIPLCHLQGLCKMELTHAACMQNPTLQLNSYSEAYPSPGRCPPAAVGACASGDQHPKALMLFTHGPLHSSELIPLRHGVFRAYLGEGLAGGELGA